MHKKFTYLPLILLFVFWSLIVLTNYTPNTWLTGWDTLHPEFDFLLNLKRVIWGVWRPEQGVGAVAIHSHMSELPRILFLWLTSIVFPTEMLRYVFFFTTLIVGPLGVYFFIKESFNKNEEKIKIRQTVAPFLGALVYLLNLGTLQHYYVPFEMFAVQYALLPWTFYSLLRYFHHPSRKRLLVLLIVSFIGAPQAYAATLAYVEFGALFLFALIYQFFKKSGQKLGMKRMLTAMLIILIANSFWLLPNIYSVLTQSQVVENAQINKLFSQEAFLSNQNYGTFRDLALHKNFLFSWLEYDDSSEKFVQLLDEWRTHTQQLHVKLIGYGVALTSLVGALYALVKRPRVSVPMLVLGIVGVFFYINQNFPFTEIYRMLRENISLFEEGFRTPFTKISVLVLFVTAYFFACFTDLVAKLFDRRYLSPFIFIFGFVITVSLVSYMSPAFNGNLISPSMRNEIPQAYFEMNKWFNDKPYGRIAKFPIHSPYGWTYHDWGYEGAGFTWFGIKQPQFDRDFDRWSANNESFYNQARYALYSKDGESFFKVLDKYNVKYLIVDKSVINAGGSNDSLYVEKIETLINERDDVRLVSSIDFINIYETNYISDEIIAHNNIEFTQLSHTDQTYSLEDFAFNKYGNYINAIDKQNILSHPFSNLDQRRDVKITVTNNVVSLEKDFSRPVQISSLNIPGMFENEKEVFVELYGTLLNDNTFQLKAELVIPTIYADEEIIYKPEPKIIIHEIPYLGTEHPSYLALGDHIFSINSILKGTTDNFIGYAKMHTKETVTAYLYSDNVLSTNEDFSQRLFQSDPRKCSDPSEITNLVTSTEGFELNASEDSYCLGTYLNLDWATLFELKFNSSSESGLPPRICLAKSGVEGCQTNYSPDEFSAEEMSYTFRQPIAQGDYWLDFVAQAQTDEQPRTISYSGIQLNTLSMIGSTLFEVTGSTEEKLSFETPTLAETVKITFPVVGSISENLLVNRGAALAQNCNLQDEGNVLKNRYADGGLRYVANNGGIACDYFEYPRLDADGFILHITGENVAGRGLKVYLNHFESDVNSLESILPNVSFNESYVVYPIDSDKAGFGLSLETRAFGRVKSENIITRIEFIPIPFNWLRELSFGNEEKIKSNLILNSWSKYTPLFYKVNVSGTGILELDQGRDNGWIAYSPQNGLLEHVAVNSWANGWQINEGIKDIYIFFCPQSLQWVGTTLLLGTIGMLFRKNR